MLRGFDSFEHELIERLKARGTGRFSCWPEFERRLDAELGQLTGLLFELYGDRPDFAYWVENLVYGAFEAFKARPRWLKARDHALPPESGWYLAQDVVGAVCYVDRWAGNFRGIAERLPYLKELGIKYLHLMPFFKSPDSENDGGYAVSSYRETNPALGSMAELSALARLLAGEDISLVADFVFNHTSDEHDWALAAKSGSAAHRDFYLTFPDFREPEEYSRTLRDIFPESRRGSFTWNEEMKRWVWTTFHSYQWDLNYRNPAVFNAMAGEMLALANHGVAALRLDAVAFIWKEKGTPCENLPQAHTIIRAFQSVVRLACPSLLFKSEAIVHPDSIARYIDMHECQLSYNPLLMAELWEAAATKEVRLLAYSLKKRHHLPSGCVWVNYLRCHDDIGWTFADEDAAALGIKGFDHRQFLNRFYLGEFPGSFAQGLKFQYNPATQDMRICGTAASLAGIERDLRRDPGKNREIALRRFLLLYGIVFSAGGLPLIYLGDELGMENDPDWDKDPAHAGDSRWVHRPVFREALFEERHDPATVTGSVFAQFKKMIRARAAHRIFAVQDIQMIESGHPSVLIFRKVSETETLVVVGNFSEHCAGVSMDVWHSLFEGITSQDEIPEAVDLLSDRHFVPEMPPELLPCELVWLYMPNGGRAQ
ncbi:MAG: amylosucrase [Rectinema sp.]|jgi:amylosucrase